MNINEKLDRFLKTKESHACLVYGPWGVGKTYAVEMWLSSLKNNEDFKEYKVIRLPLFGVSTINDLNAMALKEEGLKNKFIGWLKGLNQDINVGVGPVSVGIPLIGMVSTLLKEEHGKKKKLLFVIDDIERKDNALKIGEVLGFVDSLPADNTKVILIANLEELRDRSRFDGFKEKVVQEECKLDSPQKEAIVSIIGEQYADRFITNEYPIKNLRTLIKIKRILSHITRDVDDNLLDCIYYCCLNICEKRLGKADLKEIYNIARIGESVGNGKADKEKIEEETTQFVDGIKTEPDFIYENVKRLNLLNGIRENSLKDFISDVYSILSQEDYEKFESLTIPRRNIPLKTYEEYGNSVFYSKNPNVEYKAVMENFGRFFESDEYDLLKLLNNFYLTVSFCKDFVSVRSEGKIIEKQIIKKCPKLVASYLFNNATVEELKDYFFIPSSQSWVFDNERDIAKAYAKIFNEHYVKEAKCNRLDMKEFQKRLNVIDGLFPETRGFNASALKIDEIMVNVIQRMEIILREDLVGDEWHNCHVTIQWIADKRGKYGFEKTIKLINSKALKKTLSGKRFSFLVKQYDLKEKANN